jgi:hypothetical protein
MPQVIDIPEVGAVEFPDEMGDEAIAKAIETNILPRSQKRAALMSQLEGERNRSTPVEEMALNALGNLDNTIRGDIEFIANAPAQIAQSIFGGPEPQKIEAGKPMIPIDANALREGIQSSPFLSRTILGSQGVPELAQSLSGMTTPENMAGLPAFGSGVAGRVLVSGFGAKAAVDIREIAGQAGENWDQMTPQEKSQLTADALVAATMVVAPATHAAVKSSEIATRTTKAEAANIDLIARQGMNPGKMTQEQAVYVDALKNLKDENGVRVAPATARTIADSLDAIKEAVEPGKPIFNDGIEGTIEKAERTTKPVVEEPAKQGWEKTADDKIVEGRALTSVEKAMRQKPVEPEKPLLETLKEEAAKEPDLEAAVKPDEVAAEPVKEPAPAPEPAIAEAQKPVLEAEATKPTQEPALQTKSPNEALATPASKVLGLTGTPTKIPISRIERAWDSFKSLFRARGNLPKEAYELKQRMDQERAMVGNQVRRTAGDLMAALMEHFELSGLDVAGGGSKRILPDFVQMMDDYYKGRIVNPEALPPKVRGILDDMRAHTDYWSNEVLKTLRRQRDSLPEAERANADNLIQTIENNLGVYVHRAYKFFDSKLGAEQWWAELPYIVKQKAIELVQENRPDATPAQAESLLRDWLSDLKDSNTGGVGGKVGSKDNSIFMRRNVIPKEIIDVLGEHRSPLINYARSVEKMAGWVAAERFLRDVKTEGMGNWLFEEGQNPPGFNTRIGGEGSKTIDPLGGLRTTEFIAQAFKKAIDGDAPSGAIMKWWYRAVGQTKFAATAQSLLTQQRNMLSRPWLAITAGHLGAFRYVIPSAKALWKDSFTSDRSSREYVDSAYKAGVIGDTWSGGELKALMRDALLEDVPTGELYQWSMLRAVKKYGWDIPQQLYKLSDEIGNLAGWENEKASQRKIHPEWTDERVGMESAKIVREIYPHYSTSPQVIKAFRKLPTGPFVTFFYQQIRSTVNSINRGLRESRSSNEAERKVGRDRLEGVALALLVGYMVQEVSKKMLGISDKEEEDYRKFLPDWSKNSKYIFTGADPKTGELSTINLSYLDPTSGMTDPLVALWTSLRTEEPAGDVGARVAGEALRPLLGETMLVSAGMDVARNTTKTGADVYNKTDDNITKVGKSIGHILTTLAPQTAVRIKKRIIPSFSNEQPEYGRKLEPGREVARELTGIAFEKFNFKNGLYDKSREFVSNDKESERVFRGTVAQRESATPQDILASYIDSDKRRFEYWSKMRGFYEAAIRRGVAPEEAAKIMQRGGIPKRDSMRIIANQYSPMPVTDSINTLATERKRQIPMKEIQDYRASVAGKSLN